MAGKREKDMITQQSEFLCQQVLWAESQMTNTEGLRTLAPNKVRGRGAVELNGVHGVLTCVSLFCLQDSVETTKYTKTSFSLSTKGKTFWRSHTPNGKFPR